MDNGDNWKQSLALLHRKKHPTPHKQHISSSYGKENQNVTDLAIESTYGAYDSLALTDPAIAIFDASTPKYKMRDQDGFSLSKGIQSLNDSRVSDTMWEGSFLRPSPQHEKSIEESVVIDYKGNQDCDGVNMDTPTRVRGCKSKSSVSPESDNEDDVDINTSDACEGYGSVIRTLNFGASVEGELSVISRCKDDSGVYMSASYAGFDHSYDDEKTNAKDGPPVTPEKATKSIDRPQQTEISPESEVIRNSEVTSQLKKHLPSTPVGTAESIDVSPTTERSSSAFAAQLQMHGQENREDSFIDALTNCENTNLSASERDKNDTSTAILSSTPSSKPTLLPEPPSAYDTRKQQQQQVHGDEWKEARTPQGKTYYYNRRTRASSWKLPDNAVYVHSGDHSVRIFAPTQPEANSEGGGQNKSKSFAAAEGKSGSPAIAGVKSDDASRSAKSDSSGVKSDSPSRGIKSDSPSRSVKSGNSGGKSDSPSRGVKSDSPSRSGAKSGSPSRSSVKSGSSEAKSGSPSRGVKSDSPSRSGAKSGSPSRSSVKSGSSEAKSGSPSRGVKSGSPSRSIYSPLSHMSTPMRPPTVPHAHTASPGVAFKHAEAGTIGGLGCGSNNNSQVTPVSDIRRQCHTTSRLDSLREDTSKILHNTRGVSLFSDDNSSLDYMEKVNEREEQTYCPICGSSQRSELLRSHAMQCVAEHGVEKLVEIVKILSSVVTTAVPIADPLPSSSELTPLRLESSSTTAQLQSSPAPSGPESDSLNPASVPLSSIDTPEPSRKNTGPESELSAPLPVPVTSTVSNTSTRSYVDMYESRAILLGSGGRKTPKADTRDTQSQEEDGSVRSGKSSSSATTVNRTRPMSTPQARSSRGVPPNISPDTNKALSGDNFICPCCHKGDLKSREELLSHMRRCVVFEEHPSTRPSRPNQAQSPVKDVFGGSGEPRSVCPFCGRPSTKHNLSSHLLSCKKRKASQERRHLPVTSQTMRDTSTDRTARTQSAGRSSSRLYSATTSSSARGASPQTRKHTTSRPVAFR